VESVQPALNGIQSSLDFSLTKCKIPAASPTTLEQMFTVQHLTYC